MAISFRLRRVVFLTTILLFNNFSLLVWAEDPESIKKEIRSILVQRHPVETPEFWRGLGDEAPRVIIDLHRNETSMFKRTRLLSGLAFFSTPEAIAYLEEVASQTENSVERQTAIRSVARSTKDVSRLEKYLTHKDPQTRMTAARELEGIGSSDALQRLKKFKSGEKVSWIVAKLDRNLPKVSKGLVVAAQNDDQLSREFEGIWVGHWLIPKRRTDQKKTIELARTKARVRLTRDSARSVRGVLKVGNRKWKWVTTQGKGPILKGYLEDPAREGVRIPYETRITKELGHYLMRVSLPTRGATLVLLRR